MKSFDQPLTSMEFPSSVLKRCLLLVVITVLFGCSTFTKQKIVGEWDGTIQMKGLDNSTVVKTIFKDDGYYATYVGFKGLEMFGSTEPGKWDYDGELKMTGLDGETTTYGVNFESDDHMILTDPKTTVNISCKRVKK